MKYFSIDTVITSYIKNKDCAKNRFWGLLTILSTLDNEVKSSISYNFSVSRVSTLLEDIFNISEAKKQYTSTDSWFVLFSKIWVDKVQEQMIGGKSKPNAYNIAIWFLRNNAFEDGASQEDILNTFRKRINISQSDFNDLFDTTHVDISFTSKKYTEDDLLSALKIKLHDTSKNTNISAEGDFIVSNAGELSRAPFVQTMYASQKSTECLLITQFDFTKEYSVNKEIDNVVNQDPHKIYTKEDFFEQAYMNQEQYNEILEILNRKKNIILQGAPGVGKSFIAKRLAYSILGNKDNDKIEFVQFHQSYAYEDFVVGYKPTETGFKIEYGPFYEFCKKAEAGDGKYFFIIDEINRGNLSRIFGELLVLLEASKRNEDATLLYTKELFHVPDNVYIIGMMNTADRSLAMLDYALRRRFGFFTMEPAFELDSFKRQIAKINNSKTENLIAKLKDLNSEIEQDSNLGRGFKVGHSYLCVDNATDDSLRAIVKYEIIPLLEEYWYDEPSKIEKWSNELLSALR